MHILLGPTITQVLMRISGGQINELPVLLSSMTRVCPNLATLEFTLDTSIWSGEVTHALYEFVCAFTHLRSLYLPASMMITDMIKGVGNLTELRHLEVVFPDLDNDIPTTLQVQDAFSVGDGQFPKLRDFRLHARDPGLIKEAMESLQCPLEYVSITIGGEYSPYMMYHLQMLTVAFLDHRCIPSLMTLFLSTDDEAIAEYFDLPIGDAFRLLFSLTALQTLEIGFYCTAALDDDWLADAAIAWPHLQSISLLHHCDFPVPTLAGLIPLIRHCPQLHYLCVPVAAQPFNHGLLEPEICNTAIRVLELDTSSIQGPPIAVFRCLMRMFPNLTSICCDDMSDDDLHNGWNAVSDWLQESVWSSYKNAEE